MKVKLKDKFVAIKVNNNFIQKFQKSNTKKYIKTVLLNNKIEYVKFKSNDLKALGYFFVKYDDIKDNKKVNNLIGQYVLKQVGVNKYSLIDGYHILKFLRLEKFNSRVIKFNLGDSVRIRTGSFKDLAGIITSINKKNKEVSIKTIMFDGREITIKKIKTSSLEIIYDNTR